MTEVEDTLSEAFEALGIRVGDLFEDCSFHPVLCLGADYEDDAARISSDRRWWCEITRQLANSRAVVTTIPKKLTFKRARIRLKTSHLGMEKSD